VTATRNQEMVASVYKKEDRGFVQAWPAYL